MGNNAGHIRFQSLHKHIDISFAGIGLPVRDVIHDLRQPVSCRKSAVDSVGGITGRIHLMEFVAQHTACLKALLRADLENLIARRVHNHAGMVVVRLHHMLDIALPVSGEIDGIIIAYLALVPHIHQFVHHIDAQPVAGFQQRLGRRIVG